MSGEKTVMFAMPGQRAVLQCTAGRYAGRTFELSAGTFTIGRSPECSLPLVDDTGASRLHTKIWLEGDVWTVADNDSRNGTIVNGRATKHATLNDGDVVRISGCELRFVLSDDADAEPAAQAQQPLSRTGMHRATSMPTMSIPTMKGPSRDDDRALPTDETRSSVQRPPSAVRPAPRPVMTAPPPPLALSQPTPLTQTLPGAPKKQTSPAVIIGAMVGGVVCAGLVVVGVAVAVKKSGPAKPVSVIVAQAPVTSLPKPPAPTTDPQTPDPKTSAPTTTTEPPPVALQAKPTEPKPTEAKPTHTEPRHTDPKPTEPKPTEPKPTEPKPTEPKPTEPKRAPETRPETRPDSRPELGPETVAVGNDWVPASVDSGAVDVVRSKSRGTIATLAVKDGDTVNAGQTVLTFAGGVDGPSVVVASAAGRLEGLKVKAGDGVQKGVMLFRLVDASPKGLVRAVLPPGLLAKARVGAPVEIKKRRGGTSPARIIRISGAAIVVDPGDVEAAVVESLRLP